MLLSENCRNLRLTSFRLTIYESRYKVINSGLDAKLHPHCSGLQAAPTSQLPLSKTTETAELSKYSSNVSFLKTLQFLYNDYINIFTAVKILQHSQSDAILYKTTSKTGMMYLIEGTIMLVTLPKTSRQVRYSLTAHGSQERNRGRGGGVCWQPAIPAWERWGVLQFIFQNYDLVTFAFTAKWFPSGT